MSWEKARRGGRRTILRKGELISRMRRRVGLGAVQAMARHRLARVPYVGVSRAVVQARAQRRAQPGAGAGWVYDAQDIYL